MGDLYLSIQIGGHKTQVHFLSCFAGIAQTITASRTRTIKYFAWSNCQMLPQAIRCQSCFISKLISENIYPVYPSLIYAMSADSIRFQVHFEIFSDGHRTTYFKIICVSIIWAGKIYWITKFVIVFNNC